MAITINVEWDPSAKWFRADCSELAGSPPVGLGCTIEHAVCSLVGHPDLREQIQKLAKGPKA